MVDIRPAFVKAEKRINKMLAALEKLTPARVKQYLDQLDHIPEEAENIVNFITNFINEASHLVDYKGVKLLAEHSKNSINSQIAVLAIPLGTVTAAERLYWQQMDRTPHKAVQHAEQCSNTKKSQIPLIKLHTAQLISLTVEVQKTLISKAQIELNSAKENLNKPSLATKILLEICEFLDFCSNSLILEYFKKKFGLEHKGPKENRFITQLAANQKRLTSHDAKIGSLARSVDTKDVEPAASTTSPQEANKGQGGPAPQGGRKLGGVLVSKAEGLNKGSAAGFVAGTKELSRKLKPKT